MDYRWWHGNQYETRNRIRRELDGNVNFTEHDGNIWSIRHKGWPVFVAHMDTVALCDESKTLKLKRGRLSRLGSALGADDRAGINLIMNHYKKINFIFTRDEEIGRLGARELVKHLPFLQDLKKVSCVVELDCTGHKKIRGAVHGYCMPDLVQALKKVIPDLTDTHGSFSDLDSFIPWKAGINLSVGYYKQHTTKEYLVIKEYDYVNSIILDLNKELRGEYKVYIAPPKQYWNWRTKEFQSFPMTYPAKVEQKQKAIEAPLVTLDPESNELVCDVCSANADELVFVDTLEMYICQECALDLYLDMVLLRSKGGLTDFENDFTGTDTHPF